jgi:cyclomaltodextrinase
MAEIRLGRYRHFKGAEYEVLGIAKHSETLEKLVVYRALYGEQQIWVRPVEMFQDFKEREGEKVPRFEYIGSVN